MPTDGNIRVLPDPVVNKIAAGEVVERPASVVKELVENAIDAGATAIEVDIAVGGRKLVGVADTGSGMNRDNAVLSLERHATSKIRDADDIERIATLGFRGEALAAIAAVSRFRMTTCRSGELSGTEVLVTGGKLQDVRDAGCPPGTRIEVRDLFFNVPARRKFLRSQQTELGHIRDVFLVQALSHPELGMTLRVDGRDTYRLPGNTTLDDRLRDLFGPDYAKGLRAVDHVRGEVTVRGYAGAPDATRADRNEQYVFINGRAASAPLVNFAIQEAYRAHIPRGRHPVVFLFVSMDPTLVDVNVHPSKREVRFRHPGDVRDALIEALQRALCAEGAAPAGAAALPAGTAAGGLRPAAQVQLNIADLPATRTFRYPRLAAAPAPAGGEAPPPFGPAGGGERAAPAPAPARAGTTAGPAIPLADEAAADAGGTAPWAWCRVLGQIGSLYVVLETEEGLVLMDPRAAHERVLFEKLLGDARGKRAAAQNLLIPETVEMRPREAARVRDSLAVLQSMGFGISEFGGDAFVVDAVPASVAGAGAGPMLREIAADLEEAGGRRAHERWREVAVAEAASRAAVQSRDKLALEEIEQLVVDLARADMPYTSPRGRPTIIFMSFGELNRKFGRT